MSDNPQEKAKLIDSIRREAESEIRQIEADAANEIESRKRSIDAQIERIVEEERKRADEQIAHIERRQRVAEQAKKRRNDLALRKRLIDSIKSSAEESLMNRLKTTEANEMLTGWITEGIVALEAERVVLEGTLADAGRLEAVRNEAETRASKLLGKRVSIESISTSRVGSAGVVVRDIDGEHAFDNTIEARLQRYEHEINRVIAEQVFGS